MAKHSEIDNDGDDPILSQSLDSITNKPMIDERLIANKGRYEIYKLGRLVDVVDTLEAAKWATPEAGYTIYRCEGHRKYPVNLGKSTSIPGNRMKMTRR